MERLTRRIGGSVVFPDELLGASLAPDNEYVHKLLTSLAAYEDTGLDPDEIRCLLQTGAGGLYKKLPCKEGEPVWWIGVNWLPGNGKMYRQIESGKFRYAMLDWQNPVYTSQATAEAALAAMSKEAGLSIKNKDFFKEFAARLKG